MVLGSYKHAWDAWGRGLWSFYADDSQHPGVFLSHGPQDPKRSKSSKPKKGPAEGVTLLSQVACSVIFCSCVSPSPAASIQGRQVALAGLPTQPGLAKRPSEAVLLSTTTWARESQGFGGAAVALAVGSEYFRARRSFRLIGSLCPVLPRDGETSRGCEC